jgi:6-phosphogluconolactonase (cycloisomerase 2 family)
MRFTHLAGCLAATLLLAFQAGVLAQSDIPVLNAPGPRARFLYVASGDLNSIVGYKVDSDGSLAGPQYISVDGFPTVVVADPFGQFLFAIEYEGILAFKINSQTGALTEVPGSPFATGDYGDYPTAIGIDPGGKFVYVSITDLEGPFMQAFSINRSSGVLTGAPTSTELILPTNAMPTSIQTDLTGHFVYLVDPGSGAIIGYPVNLTDGYFGGPIAPTPFAAGLGASVLTAGADVFYVCARNQLADLVGYRIDHNSGAIRPVPGTFFVSHGGDATSYITIDPVHNKLYQPTFLGNIGIYEILPNGALHFQNFTANNEVMAAETLLVDASATLLFAVGASASYERAPPMITSFHIDATTGNLALAGYSQAFNSLNYYSSIAVAP